MLTVYKGLRRGILGTLSLLVWLGATQAAQVGTVELSIRFEGDAISFPQLDRGQGVRFVGDLTDAVFKNENTRATFAASGVQSFTPVAPWFRHLPERNYDKDGNEIQLVDQTGDYCVVFSTTLEPARLATLIGGVDGIAHASVVPPGEFFYSPNDAYFSSQWYLTNSGGSYSIATNCAVTTNCGSDWDINAPEGWDDTRVPGTKIGLIDTGIRSSHEDLSDSYDWWLSETGDNCGHGTAVSGVLVGKGNNSVGVAGVARANGAQSSDKLVVLKGVNGGCSPDMATCNAALSKFANDANYYPNVLIVNESFGGAIRKWDYDVAERDAHRNAYLKGLSIFTASGNSASCSWQSTDSCLVYPAAYNNFVTSVTGYNCAGNNPNAFPPLSHTDLAAPSDGIVTTDYSSDSAYQGKGGINANCGTSFSSPIAAGVAALLLNVDPSLGPDDIGAVLRRTATDRGASGRDDTYGYGQLRLNAAVDFLSSPHVIRFGSTSSYTGTYVASRNQEFRRVPGANGNNDDWQTFWVKVYRVDVTVTWSLPNGESIVDAWPRKRLTTGFPNESKLDARMLTGYAEVVPGTLSNTGCTLRTYTYKIYTDSSESTCLNWYPLSVSGQGACGSSAGIAKFDYTYVSTTAAPGPRSPRGSVELKARSGGDGSVVLEQHGLTDVPGRIEVFDASGRVLAAQTVEPGDSWPMRVALRGSVGRRSTPSGVYFARFVDNMGNATNARLVLVK